MRLIRLHPSGKEVPVEPGDTVLAALERAGYALPNNCRAGACGECKTRVRSGSFDQGIVLQMALSDAERADGFGLMCMAKPTGELLEIEFGTADAQPKLFPPRERVPFVVVDRFQRTPRILELRLRPLGDPLRYWPGQHVLLGNPRAGAPPRSYSIANAPRPDGELILLVTRQPGGATSGWIHEQLLVGDETALTGPYGTFIGDPSVETPVLCLAAGSGLAPILALTDAALRRGFAQPVTLLFSARSEEDVYHRGLMKYWEARHRRFRFIRTLTGGDGPPPIGRIPEVLPAIAPDLSSYSVFIAGSPQFVEDCSASVRRLGAQPQRVHTEGYFPQAVPSPPPNERLI